ncbi:MAG: catalase [Ruminococcaceae bacterium]|nr:catalase [Oscillospiraceae bacterium]
MHPFRHFRTITRHRHRVIAHCFKAGIGWQGLRHDLSKYTPAEFFAGARYYRGTRSPNEVEREIYGYSPAWLHHKGRNRHHFEYWTDYNPATKTVEPVKMPLRYVAEMFCDRVAASKIYQGAQYHPRHPLDYYERGKPRRRIHPDTAALLEGWLRLLAEQGEEAAFAAIRAKLRAGEEY